MLDLTEWIAEVYLCGWGQVLETVVPQGVKQLAGTRTLNVFSLAKGAKTLRLHLAEACEPTVSKGCKRPGV